MMELLRSLPFLAAALALLIGIFFYLQNRSRLRRWLPAVGQVTGSQMVHANKGTRYAPEIRFSTPDGRTITFVSQYYLMNPPVVTTSVSVLYDAKDPTRAELKAHATRQHAALVCIICAAVFCVGGLPLILR